MPVNNTSEDIIQQMKALEKRVEILEKTNPLNNGTVDQGGITVKSSFNNSRMYLGEGLIGLWDDYVSNPEQFGLIYCDPEENSNLFRIFPPFTDGDGLQNSITIRGEAPGIPGNVWIYTQGLFQVLDSRAMYFGASEGIDMVVDEYIGLYGIPSAGTPAYQLGYDSGSGRWSIVLDTSSRRYKTNIENAEFDFDKVLDLQPVTFKNISDVESVGERFAPERFGLIAEDVDDIGLGLPLVTYNEEGEPDAIKYSLVAVSLIPVVRNLRERVIDLEHQVAHLQNEVQTLRGNNE